MSTLYWVELQDIKVPQTQPTADDDARDLEVEVVAHLGMLW